jgi:hypothetical protein
MKRIIPLFLLITLLSNTDNREMFFSPLEIPLNLSANFGELRPDHFHSGIDLKTNGTTGHRVLAADDGYVYRISIGPSGFGKAIYLRHKNGFSTVYGHLDSFIPELDNYTKEEQYSRERFEVELYPQKDQFSFKKGDQIAYSGNSGSSMGPHLHFEVRRSSNENPVDPFKYYDIPDNIKPIIDRVVLYPLSDGSTINGYNEKVKFKLTGNKGRYSVDSPVIKVKGEIGIGVTTWDYLDNNWNKCGVRSVEMKLDGKTLYLHSIDEFSFSESRYINSHIDYSEQVKSKTYIQKTFLEPNNRLSIYQHSENNGKIVLSDNELHNVELTISDYSGNTSRVSFLISQDEFGAFESQTKDVSRVVPFNEEIEYIRHDVSIKFPRDCFYDTLFFVYRMSPNESGLYSDIHHIHNKYSPVHKSFDLAIKPFDVPEAMYSKICFVRVDEGGISYAGGEWKNGYVEGKVRSLGTYAIGADTISPTIKPVNFSKNSDLRGRKELRFAIDDDFSGIASYSVTIDGEWALFDWDPKNRIIVYRFDDSKIIRGKDHIIEAFVTDNKGNSSSLSMSILW